MEKQNQLKNKVKVAINTYISVFNINGLNAPIKKQSGRLD